MTIYNRSYLIENTTSDNRSRARKYMRKESGMSKDESMQLDHQLQTQFKNVGKCECKFMLGLTRMYMNGELEGTIGEGDEKVSIASLVNQCLGIVAEEPYASQFDFNLNGLTAMQFIDAFQDKVEAAGNEDKENLSKQDFGGNNGYDIVLIDSFEKARGYSMYTDWCVTKNEEAYKRYTKGGTFYFCLKSGFENVERAAGTNTPLDEYGLSMIAVSIYPDGKCNTITCRWNHDNGGDDNVMTTEELSKVIGENFYDVFKPVRRTLTLDGKEYVDGVTDDGYKALYDKQGNNVLGAGVKDFWLDAQMSNVFGIDVLCVEAETCVNFLLFKEGNSQYLFDEWFDWCVYDDELSKQVGVPCFEVTNNGKKNCVILRDGKTEYLFDEWFDWCVYDDELSKQVGVPCFEVTNNGKKNCVILRDGKTEYLFDEWFDWCVYDDELCKQVGVPCFEVTNNGKKKCVIFRDGKTEYLFDDRFDACVYDDELCKQVGVPCFRVMNDRKTNYIKYQKGTIKYLFDEWFDACVYDDKLSQELKVPYFKVLMNGKVNYAKLRNGKAQYLFNKWYDYCSFAFETSDLDSLVYFRLTLNDKINYVVFPYGGKERYLFDEWVDSCFVDYSLSYQCCALIFSVEKENIGQKYIMIKNGKVYFATKWNESKNDSEYDLFDYLRQKKESKTQHLSDIITEMVMRKLR